MISQTNFSDDEDIFRKIRIVVEAGKPEPPHNEKILLNLAGGIPSNSFSDFKFTITIQGAAQYVLEVESDLYTSKCHINMANRYMSVSNCVVTRNRRKSKLGTFIFSSMVREAREIGLQNIFLFAAGNYTLNRHIGMEVFTPRPALEEHLKLKLSRDTRFNGYYACARLGCMMDEGEQEDFEEWRTYFDSGDTFVNDLIQKTKGQMDWKEFGFCWSGTFYLGDNSQCLEYLEQYIENEGF